MAGRQRCGVARRVVVRASVPVRFQLLESGFFMGNFVKTLSDRACVVA
jgi:hypothetical protein